MGSIDIGAMEEVVAGFPMARVSVIELKEAMHTWWDLANNATKTSTLGWVEWGRVDPVVAWLDDRQQKMQWRLDLARSVAAATVSGFDVSSPTPPGQCVVGIEDWMVDGLQKVLDGARSGNLTDEDWDVIVKVASSDAAGWFGALLYNNLSAEDLAQLALKLSAPFDLPRGSPGQRSGAWFPPR